jgi:RNA polymerase sigma-70 factor (ECF subfamily)
MKSSEFKSLVMPLSDRLYRLAYSLLGNREEAEDAIQEVYLKLWKMRKTLHQYDSVEALSVRMTRNQSLDFLRRRQKTREIQNEQAGIQYDNEKSPSEILEQQERKEILLKMIDQLPEPQRSLVYFRHVEEKEYQEIEKLMDMNENAIRVSISRARKKLRELIEKKYVSWTS